MDIRGNCPPAVFLLKCLSQHVSYSVSVKQFYSSLIHILSLLSLVLIFFIQFFVYKPVAMRHYNRISVSSHIALMAEQLFQQYQQRMWTKMREREKKHSSGDIPPHSVALCVTQTMS